MVKIQIVIYSDILYLSIGTCVKNNLEGSTPLHNWNDRLKAIKTINCLITYIKRF